MEKFCVLSFNAEDVRIHIDPAYENSSDDALRKVSEIRKTSHVILALTPATLRDIADKLESKTPSAINEAQKAAAVEEANFQAQKQK